MTAQEEYKQLLDTHGISLHSVGLREIGLGRKNALHAVSVLRRSSSVILGGDVYVKNGANIELAYATWSINKIPGEPRTAYLQRSWDATENYIRDYPEPSEGEPVFVFVVRD